MSTIIRILCIVMPLNAVLAIYGAVMVAIDGDYMAIALLYYALRRSTEKKIYIFRQLSQLAPTAAERAGGPARATRV